MIRETFNYVIQLVIEVGLYKEVQSVEPEILRLFIQKKDNFFKAKFEKIVKEKSDFVCRARLFDVL
jgi:hypothetical protein